LAQGDLPAAACFAQDSGLGERRPDYARESGHWSAILSPRTGPARHRTGQPTHAAAQDRADGSSGGRALMLARAATGDEAGAVTALAEALLLACPQGYVRVFADEGPPMAVLLGKLIAAQRTGHVAVGVPLGYLARLRRALDIGQTTPDPGLSGLIDPLTGREHEVLAMLAAGRSNQAIARELVITLDTVKKHVGHVLGKLGAANRTEAVARARELSLIP
jgi:LuxR family maltose regulon positive regulatory protein